jgi:hypothetical protein
MSLEKISLIIFFASFLSLAVFIWRKIPVLANATAAEGSFGKSLFGSIKEKFIETSGLKNFSLEIILQKILSRIRIISLKTDQKTFDWLRKLREKNQKKRLEDANYWERIENSTQDPKE